MGCANDAQMNFIELFYWLNFIHFLEYQIWIKFICRLTQKGYQA